jgi:hypothetical protein
LVGQYAAALAAYSQRRAAVTAPVTEETGLYLELTSMSGCKLPLESLDTARDYRLQSLHREGEAEVAVIFVPDSRRTVLQGKLQAYLNPQRDRSAQNPKPSNRRLVDSIAQIRLANLRSFWTDDLAFFPTDANESRWWELWLSKQGGLDLLATAGAFAQRLGAQLGNTSITFHNSAVVLIRAKVAQLEQATELISCLAELRAAKETPTVLVRETPAQQQAWADDLRNRTQVESGANVFVTILDTGVNFDHPLLSAACDASLATVWDSTWPPYTASTTDRTLHHGSEQAGLALFGDLHAALMSTDALTLTHQVESGRILAPFGNNDPELYGAITTETAIKLETARPDAKRVYSMAVTASPDRQGGQPTSWSSRLDSFCAGSGDEGSRLFVVAAGNNRDLNPQLDYWDQAQLVEDPAQSWNALTVGAYTELTTNNDDAFEGWSPLAKAGDLCPLSRTSVNWSWRKHAPVKPELVAEGGNVLLSPDRTATDDADTVSLLTTSGRATGQLFATTGATSAATALVSRQAALLMAEYPDLWPETIRGLLVHSAEWSPRMYERRGQLEMHHSQKLANETMLRTFGYGVPDLDRARYSANHLLTLIAQNDLQPYQRDVDATASTNAKLHEMHLYELPWPVQALQALDPEIELRMKVTLSYFVEPNPGRRGYRDRFTYPSHGLRFEVIRPEQPLGNFKAFVNALADREDYTGPEGSTEGWRFGPHLRTRGSLHCDIWTGSSADLARMNAIAVFPVSGWWKARTSTGRWNNRVRYSLIVSIEAPHESIDIYGEVFNTVSAEVTV